MVDSARPLDKLLESMEPGNRYRFRLRANPTRRVHRRATLEMDAKSTRSRTEEAASIGKRVELTREEDQIAWLKRRGEAAGFSVIVTRLVPDQGVLALQAGPSEKMVGRRQGQRLTLATVLFDGVLQVTDDALFRDALVNGVGPGKAFGCGLLSIAPIFHRTA
jgi:CRISPR system Cascade subunit CasE